MKVTKLQQVSFKANLSIDKRISDAVYRDYKNTAQSVSACLLYL